MKHSRVERRGFNQLDMPFPAPNRAGYVVWWLFLTCLASATILFHFFTARTTKLSSPSESLRRFAPRPTKDTGSNEDALFTKLEAMESKVDSLLVGDTGTDTTFTQVLVSLKGDFSDVLNETPRELGETGISLETQYLPQRLSVETQDLSQRIDAAIQKAQNVDPLPQGDRPKIRLFVGVFTGPNDPALAGKQTPEQKLKYDYRRRRQALRDTWFPNSVEERERLEREKGIVIRFIVGNSEDAEEQELLAEEQEQHHDFLRLPLTESYHGLTNKTRTFFAAALTLYDPDWVVKVDDDVYYMVERTLLAMRQWDKNGATYVGCMQYGPVFKQEGSRWYEPQHMILGSEYFLHTFGSIYALHKSVVENVILRNFHTLRILANEDVSVGCWLLGHNVTHFEDKRLCTKKCSSAAVGILDNVCAGLCNPLEDLYAVHKNESCAGPPEDPLPYLPSSPQYAQFDTMHV